MFENCKDLAELNQQRQHLMRSRVPPIEVNSAYNKAKRELLQKAQQYRRIPTFSDSGCKAELHYALPILSVDGRRNEIVITERGVIL